MLVKYVDRQHSERLEMDATVSTHRISISSRGKKMFGFPWVDFRGC